MIDPGIQETRRCVDHLLTKIQECPYGSPEQVSWFEILKEYLWMK